MRSSVLLPQPLGPTMVTKLPSSMLQSMSLRASTPPPPSPKCLDSPSKRM